MSQSAFTKKAVNNSGEEYEIPPPGQYGACLVGLIDLGTHTNTYQGQTSEQHRIFLCWELTDEQNSSGENYVVAKDYTWSLHKKAKFRQLLEGWAGKELQEGEELDPVNMVGLACCVN